MTAIGDWWRTYSPPLGLITTSIGALLDLQVAGVKLTEINLWAWMKVIERQAAADALAAEVAAIQAVAQVGEEVATKSAEAEREVKAAGGEIGKEASAQAAGIGRAILDGLKVAWAWLVDHARWLLREFEALLEAIHFKTILLCIQIAQIISPAFRAMMKKVYDAISRLSAALGFGPDFLVMALRNSRTLVMSVGAVIGRTYDLGQVKWLSELNTWLQKASTMSERYKNHPELVFEDLENDIEKNFANDGAGVMAGVFGTVAGVANAVLSAAQDLVKVNTDLYKLLNDLPKAVRENLPDGLLKWMWEGSWYMNNKVLPDLIKLDGLIETHAAELLRLKNEAQAAAARILSPLATVQALATLSEADKALTVDALDALDNARRAARALAFNTAMLPGLNEFEGLLRLAPPTLLPPAVLQLEPGPVPQHTLGAPTPRQTWFVGEY